MVSSLQVFQNRFIRAILISNLFSQFGIWIRNLAVLLYVMDMTQGDAWAVSMISVAEYAPIFLFSFIGGVFADRWRPKRTIVWCEWLSAISVFIVFAALVSGSWQAALFATFCSSILSQFSQPSGMKLFKMHVRDEQVQICMSTLQTLTAVFMIIGPIFGTIAYQQLGIELAMLLTGISFMLSAISMLFLPADPSRAELHAEDRGTLLREMADGIRYVMLNRELLWLNLCFMLVGLGVGLISPLSIFVITERLGLSAQDLPWIAVPYGLGEIIGGIVAFMLAAKLPPQRMLVIGLLADGIGILITGWSSALWLTIVAQFFIALFQPAIFVGNTTLVMQRTEQAYVGRVTGIRTPLMTGSMVLTMSLAGVLKNGFTLSAVFTFAGFSFLAGLCMVVPLASRSHQTRKTNQRNRLQYSANSAKDVE